MNSLRTRVAKLPNSLDPKFARSESNTSDKQVNPASEKTTQSDMINRLNKTVTERSDAINKLRAAVDSGLDDDAFNPSQKSVTGSVSKTQTILAPTNSSLSQKTLVADPKNSSRTNTLDDDLADLERDYFSVKQHEREFFKKSAFDDDNSDYQQHTQRGSINGENLQKHQCANFDQTSLNTSFSSSSSDFRSPQSALNKRDQQEIPIRQTADDEYDQLIKESRAKELFRSKTSRTSSESTIHCDHGKSERDLEPVTSTAFFDDMKTRFRAQNNGDRTLFFELPNLIIYADHNRAYFDGNALTNRLKAIAKRPSRRNRDMIFVVGAFSVCVSKLFDMDDLDDFELFSDMNFTADHPKKSHFSSDEDEQVTSQ